jgi:anaerobic C4-dicarboxylate transporter DcuA
MDHNAELIKNTLGEVVAAHPWTFALALFTLSILLFSQAATTKALMPLGLTLGLSPAYLIGIFPAVNGHFFIPGYPTLLTAIQFDRTGTTRIGKYVLNHSFYVTRHCNNCCCGIGWLYFTVSFIVNAKNKKYVPNKIINGAWADE